jgi:hypothetical protein
MSGRTLDRYLRVLEAPREVQDAFQAGTVSLVQACQVASLPADVQDQLVADIQAGTDPARAVEARLAGKAPQPQDAAFGRFIRSLQSNTAAMAEHAGAVRSLHPFDVELLKQALPPRRWATESAILPTSVYRLLGERNAVFELGRSRELLGIRLRLPAPG